MSLRHCIVAMDTHGDFIQYMPMNPGDWMRSYRVRRVWTDDWNEALKRSGEFNYYMASMIGPLRLHPNNRRNVASVEVGGYEVVSEEKSDL